MRTFVCDGFVEDFDAVRGEEAAGFAQLLHTVHPLACQALQQQRGGRGRGVRAGGSNSRVFQS